MRLKNFDLISIIFFAALNVGWAQLPVHPLILGIILAIPLVLFLPGYTLTQILFHKRASDQLVDLPSKLILQPRLKIDQPVSAVDHTIFSIGLSLAIDVLIGFILNFFPIGLALQSWAISLGLLTIAFALLAAYLRRRDVVKAKKIAKLPITIYEYMLFGLAILIATGAVWLSIIRPLQPQPSFTQFWMLSSNQKAGSCAVRIGVHNQEPTTIEYRIVVTMNGNLIRTWPSVVLASQQEWDQVVSLSRGPADNMYVEGKLYQSNKPATVYQKVNVTLHLLGNNKGGNMLQCGTA